MTLMPLKLWQLEDTWVTQRSGHAYLMNFSCLDNKEAAKELQGIFLVIFLLNFICNLQQSVGNSWKFWVCSVEVEGMLYEFHMR